MARSTEVKALIFAAASSSYSIYTDEIRQPTCGQKTAECGVNGCLLCVACPLSIAWCFVVFPFKLGKAAIKNVWYNQKRCFCGGGAHKILPDYSSSSDLEQPNRLKQYPNSSTKSRRPTVHVGYI